MTGVCPNKTPQIVSTCELGLGCVTLNRRQTSQHVFLPNATASCENKQTASRVHQWVQKHVFFVDDLFMQNNTWLYHVMSRGDSTPLTNNKGIGNKLFFFELLFND